MYVLLSDSFRLELKALVRKWEEDKVIAITNPLTISKPKVDSVYAKKKQILFVGRLTNQKGLNFLLPIWEEFTKCNQMNWGEFSYLGRRATAQVSGTVYTETQPFKHPN